MNVKASSNFLEETENSQLLQVPSHERTAKQSKRKRPHDDVSPAPGIILSEISYAVSAFYATLQPVAITLVLSSLAVVYIKSPFSQQSADGGLSIYDISDGSEAGLNDSNTVKLGKSMINAIVIVSAIALMTFVIVFLYWARCVKCILGYMILSSFMLLGFMGGIFLFTIIEQFQIRFDWITFGVLIYNFSVIGVIAIFMQKGIPALLTQSYLICSSVLLVWQLSRFDEYTCFSLLVALAFYDLFAVLSPCGPLKALVGLMQKRNVPLPGLLYEANLSSRSHRNDSPQKRCQKKDVELGRSPVKEVKKKSVDMTSALQQSASESTHIIPSTTAMDVRDANSHRCKVVLALPRDIPIGTGIAIGEGEMEVGDSAGNDTEHERHGRGGMAEKGQGDDDDSGYEMATCRQPPTDDLDMNYVSFSSGLSPLHSHSASTSSDTRHSRHVDSSDDSEFESVNDSEYDSGDETLSNEVAGREDGSLTDDSGTKKGTRTRSSIKLGLGDFVFYSMLVSRAAKHGFPSFIATSFVVLGGLGATLALLAVCKRALPALPISILLGVCVYFLTMFFVQPCLDALAAVPLYI